MAESESNSAGSLEDYFYPYRERYEIHRSIPANGVAREEVISVITEMAHSEDKIGDEGKCSGSIYSGDHEHYRFLSRVFERFAHANVLQRDMYPSATKLEGEIVSMTLGLMGGASRGGEACGVLTSGGSESLMSALFAYREWAREEKGVTEPEVIIPNSAHVAIDKGGHYFGVKVLRAPLGPDFLVDLDWVESHITPNTVALFGSAGSYPYGLVDPIAELGQLALRHGIGLHVDGCLGGFLLPFGRMLGRDIPAFDFSVPGVTSISADTHKYGYALKGTSVLMYANRELRRRQYFTYPDWPGGLYLSPGMAGSRSGGLIAATWAAMVSLGVEGYTRIADAIFTTADKLIEGIRAQDGIQLYGEPTFSAAFGSDEFDIFLANDYLAGQGWRLNGLQLPPGLHFCVTRPNTYPGVMESFLDDLAGAVDFARVPGRGPAASGALYGLAGTAEGNQAVDGLLSGALDAYYEAGPGGEA